MSNPILNSDYSFAPLTTTGSKVGGAPVDSEESVTRLLGDKFKEVLPRLSQAPGMPPGVFVMNPLPDQSLATLGITQIDVAKL